MRLLSGTEYGAPRQQPVGVRPRLHRSWPVPIREEETRRRAGFRGSSGGTRRGEAPEAPHVGRSCFTQRQRRGDASDLGACIFSRNRPSPGVVIARAARIPGIAAPRQGPPRREPRDRDPRMGSPPTRAYTTFRPEPDPSRPSAVASPYSDHRQFFVRVYRPSSTVRIPTADHVNAQYTPSSPHTQFLYQWRSLPITFIREERTRPDRFPDDGADTSAVASTRSQARSLPPARVASRPEIGLETAVVHDCFSRMWRSTIGAKPRLNAVRVHRGPRTTHSPWSRPITRPAEPRLTSALAV